MVKARMILTAGATPTPMARTATTIPVPGSRAATPTAQSRAATTATMTPMAGATPTPTARSRATATTTLTAHKRGETPTLTARNRAAATTTTHMARSRVVTTIPPASRGTTMSPTARTANRETTTATRMARPRTATRMARPRTTTPMAAGNRAITTAAADRMARTASLAASRPARLAPPTPKRKAASEDTSRKVLSTVKAESGSNWVRKRKIKSVTLLLARSGSISDPAQHNVGGFRCKGFSDFRISQM
ncbi:hypothetical protein DFH08DRAFT_892912 [Mycena albidolilacea]|uniref:Uncharacterized protein n=1 Tax=Mycena albidolilacea TaxID=1033008 RepID=A0AAD6ZDQ4_9AGAR|nr:hypothetical protein DFH08DRAFT_892912 [Mycena albidolilacea]